MDLTKSQHRSYYVESMDIQSENITAKFNLTDMY